MALSCSDTCDLLAQKLIAAGYKVDPDAEGQEQLYKALESCVILPTDGKVQVVIGVWHGTLDDVVVCLSEETARQTLEEMDEELGIERDSDGRYEHDENDVWWREVALEENPSKKEGVGESGQ